MSMSKHFFSKSFLEFTSGRVLVHDQVPEEEEDCTGGDDHTEPLPASVVATVGLVNISLKRQDQHEVDRPWEDELDRDAPPELQDSLREPVPSAFRTGAEVGPDGGDTSEVNLVVPLRPGDLLARGGSGNTGHN